MEKVQGLQYRTEDGPTMQFWPIQHEFFPGHSCSNLPQGTPQAHLASRPGFPLADESTDPRQLPSTQENLLQLDVGNMDASGSKNWMNSWEWDSFLFTAQPTSNGHSPHEGGLPQQSQVSKFKSSSPLDKSEVNGAVSEPTLLELGLNNSRSTTDDDDGLLALKLGGNGHLWGMDELSPNVKRSRHSPPETQQPRCQVDNCTADLQNAKDYHRRHKVCEFHAKAAKAPVSRIMQRFCQQCSRFHLLKEFDDDRRSCRRRLAGHNRRRRKTQPDAAAALACLLADQNAISRIINPLEQLQGKDELERLLRVLNGGDALQTLLNARAAVGDAESKSTVVGGAPPTNDLVNVIAKSQLLNNLLLSNPTLASYLPVVAAPAETPISALSNALLSSLSQLLQINNGNMGHGGPVSVQEMGKQLEAYMNASGTNAIAKQDACSRPCTGEQPVSLAFPSSTERLLLAGERIISPMCSDKSNDSNGESMDERTQIDYAQRGGMKEGYIQQGTRPLKDRNKSYHSASLKMSAPKFQTAGGLQARDAMHTRPDTQSTSPEEHLKTTTVLGSDHSSDSGFDKQEQTFQLWFKIFDRSPADLPSSLRKQMLEWLDHLPTEMEGYIRPGCIILTVFLCMPVHTWEELCRNIEGSLYKLVWSPDGDFWRKGRVLVHLGEASAFIIEGEVYPNMNPKPLRTPSLVLVQPFAVVAGENVDLILKGHNLKVPGTKVICAYEGKCIDKEVALTTSFRERKRDRNEEQGMPLAGRDSQQEQAVTFRVGPFSNMGHSFIEVEGQMLKGNTFPIIIADRSICEEVGSLEKEFVRSLVNNRPLETTRPSKIEADITHFLYEMGWLLQRSQWKLHYIDSGIQEFSPARYRWLLRFSVEHSCCAVVRRILDLLFITGGNSMEHVYLRALEVLSEANLLHVAVRSNSRAMVESLLEYTPPAPALDPKQRYIFRPDTPSHGELTPLHVAASMRAADGVVDALTNAPEELWAMTWTSGKDSIGQTPLMYALAAGNHVSVKLVQSKLQKLGIRGAVERKESDVKPPHLALSIAGEDIKPNVTSSPRKVPLTKQIQHCTCKGREILLNQNLRLRVRGSNAESTFRPFMLSMLTIAAVCVCVGLLMKGPPSVNFVQGPFVWDSIMFGFI